MDSVIFDISLWVLMKMQIFYHLQYLLPWAILFRILTIKIDLAHSLECVYCPAHSTEDECNEMNLTQICINETKCGSARFIEIRKDRGVLFPEDFHKEVLLITMKKGCMDEDYCTRIKEKKNEQLNSTECIFCGADMCDLNFPILCVECDETEDKYCSVQTGPIKKCAPGEVCYRQRIPGKNYTEKRGCMEPSRCLKKDFCEYCKTDICWTDPIALPSLQQHQSEQTVTGNKILGRSIPPHVKSDSTRSKLHLIFIFVLISSSIYI